MIRTVANVMQRYGCDAERAQRYIDLRDEGYPQHQALLMAGLTDPPDSDETDIAGVTRIDMHSEGRILVVQPANRRAKATGSAS